MTRKILSAVAASALIVSSAFAQVAPGGGGGTPGGTNGQLQYNNSGAFGGATVGSGLSFSGGTLSATGSGSVTSIATACGISGGTITTTGTITSSSAINPQTGASYSTLATDCGNLVTFTNAGAIAVTLDNTKYAASTGFNAKVLASSTGSATFTPSSGTVDGAATFVLAPGQSTTFAFDGTNWTTAGRFVIGPASSTNNNCAKFSGTTGQLIVDAGAACGTVTGPVSAVSGHIATFNGTSGGVLQDGGAVPTPTPIGPGYKSSNWYPSAIAVGGASAGAAQPVASTIYCHAYLVSSSGTTLKALGVSVGTTGTGAVSMALYQANGTGGRPGTLVDSIGTTGASTAASPATGNLALGTDALSGGAYWACASYDGTTGTVRFVTPSNVAMPGFAGSSTIANVAAASSQIQAISCTAGGTCGAGAAWSAGSFTWPASLSSASPWTEVVTNIGIQVFAQAN